MRSSLTLGLVLALAFSSGCSSKSSGGGDLGAPAQVSKAPDSRVVPGDVPDPDEVPAPAEGTPAEGTPAEGTPAEGTPPANPGPSAPTVTMPDPEPPVTFGQTPGNQLCKDAFLKRFSIGDVGNTKPQSSDSQGIKDLDFCKTDWKPLEDVERAMRQVGKLHRAVAKFLKVSPEDLYGSGIDLKLLKDPMGHLGSYYNTFEDRIYLGIFKDWKGESLNPGVYVHELGHLLANNGPKGLPEDIRQLSDSPLLTESFADLIALGATGKVLSESNEIPQCMGRVRVVGKYTTFGFPEAFFKRGYEGQKIAGCCASVPKAQRDAHLASICSAMAEGGAAAPLNRRIEFDPKKYVESPKDYDPHQIGIPLNGFMRRLEAETGVRAIDVLLGSVAQVSNKKLGTIGVCELPMMKSFVDPVEIRLTSMGYVLQALRDQIPESGRPKFDVLWDKAKMDKAVIMSNGEDRAMQLIRLAGNTFEPVLKALKESKNAQLLSNPCYSEETLIRVDKAECYPECRKK